MAAMTDERGITVDQSGVDMHDQPVVLASPTRKRVLVIDDEPSTRYLLTKILAHAGLDTVEAEDGEAGLRMASEEKPDLVLVDGLLPKMHGFLVCKAIKELKNPPKVIVLTAVYRKITYRWEVKSQYGADELLIKPVNPPELVACIERVLSADSESGLTSMPLPSSEQVNASFESLQAKA